MKDGNCAYCMQGELAAKFAYPICKMDSGFLYVFKEQSHPGRLILAHDKHISEMIELTDEERNLFFADVARAAQALTELYHPDKINYLVLGDLCPHLHIHLVPKYEGRTDWGGIFQMMPEPRRYLEEAQEQVEIQRIREKLEEMANGF